MSFPKLMHFKDQNDQIIQPTNFANEQEVSEVAINY